MINLTEELRKLREENSDIALIIDTYKEIDLIYRETLNAMGAIQEPVQQTRNSAEVTISLESSPVTFGDEE